MTQILHIPKFIFVVSLTLTEKKELLEKLMQIEEETDLHMEEQWKK
jgi:hypothetical protein